MSEFAQIVISADQARMLHFAVESILQDEDYVMTEPEAEEFKRLAVFLSAVHGYPNHFPVTGQMAAKIKRAKRQFKVPVPQTRRNKRKARQEARTSYRKRSRIARREEVEAFNLAQQTQEQEAQEAAEFYAELNERLEKQPKFNIVDPHGKPVVEAIPAEFIVAEDGSTPLLP